MSNEKTALSDLVLVDMPGDRHAFYLFVYLQNFQMQVYVSIHATIKLLRVQENHLHVEVVPIVFKLFTGEILITNCY